MLQLIETDLRIMLIYKSESDFKSQISCVNVSIRLVPSTIVSPTLYYNYVSSLHPPNTKTAYQQLTTTHIATHTQSHTLHIMDTTTTATATAKLSIHSRDPN